MIDVVMSAITEVFYYVNTFLIFINQRNDLRIAFLLGIGVSILFVVFKILKSTIWGS